MPTPLEQFIKFSTDASGLERTFRLFQAITQVLIFVSPARALLFSLLSFLSSSPDHLSKLQPLSITTLSTLRARFAIGRRYFRVFRFLDSFNAAWKGFAVGPRGWGEWLDVGAKGFNGMYLLLETITFPDALGVEGFGIWEVEVNKVLVVEAQRFWLFALVCGIGAGWARVVKLRGMGKGEKTGEGEKEEVRRKRAEEERKRREMEWKVLRRMIADALDIAVPGAVVGWAPASPGTVGLLMLVSTWLTGLEVWERCGRELDAVRG
ncbi:peroxisomal biogenesis factor 11 [Cercophora newfieldiana]|uniref:Peroxisomal biogenesis factor 11 n=1 Tax=Cercophora newfieldiana TaxID=92897 RepID=A0AA39XVT3_9PEZI|nr:peroxisomal biogenesis factor 11 [Cercophora newfieldiana]